MEIAIAGKRGLFERLLMEANHYLNKKALTLVENKDMSDNSNGSNKVDFKEIVITNMFEIEAIVEVLEEKGIMTREDYRERVNKMKEKRNKDK